MSDNYASLAGVVVDVSAGSLTKVAQGPRRGPQGAC